MVHNRGKLRFKGKTGEWKDTIRGQRKTLLEFITYLVVEILITLGILFDVLRLEDRFGDSRLLSYFIGIVPMAMVMVITLAFIRIIGLEIDAIYSHGITSRSTMLIEKVRKCSFITYESIKLVGYGTIKNCKVFDNKKFRAIFNGKQVITYINNYENDFWDNLLNVLRQKCPDVAWIEMEWQEWKKKKDFSLDDLIEEHSSTCSSCNGRLTYIEQYDRWYCYNCEEYAPEEHLMI